MTVILKVEYNKIKYWCEYIILNAMTLNWKLCVVVLYIRVKIHQLNNSAILVFYLNILIKYTLEEKTLAVDLGESGPSQSSSL